jgi:large subunit ribosomal protein L19
MSGFAFEIEQKAIVKTDIPEFQIGDNVDVHVKIVEGNKERVQVFSGVVIARKHQGIRETFTVRRIVAGEGVERVFPLHSPKVEKIVVRRLGDVRRAKLYYLRDRVGNATRVKEDLRRDRTVRVDARRNAAGVDASKVIQVVSGESSASAESPEPTTSEA